MIDLQKVCYAYEHEVALRYIDLHIEKGDSLVIQGPEWMWKINAYQIAEWNYISIRRKLFLQGP